MLTIFLRLNQAGRLRQLNSTLSIQNALRLFASKESEVAPPVIKDETELPDEYKTNHPGLMEFFDTPDNWGKPSVKVGRPWKIDELRLKCNSDLHKLWYVLYKEMNMLLTMQEQCQEKGFLFPNEERIEKVEESMENLEKVVRERNRAYFQLEVGERSSAEQPRVFRRGPFGLWDWWPMSEHFVPFRVSKSWRTLFGPCVNKDTQDFFHAYRERIRKRNYGKLCYEHLYVRQLLRRFPDTDLEYLQKKYPRVPVAHYKENLDYYNEHSHHISFNVFIGRWKGRRAKA